MFIFETIIYIIFAWFMYMCAKKSERYFPNSQKIDKYLLCYIAFFSFISAIRWQVGTDSVTYALMFRDGLIIEDLYLEKGEYIWHYLIRIVRGLHLHFTIGLGIAAFLQIFFITKALKDYKSLLVIIPIVLFGGPYYLSLMNGVRQMIVACGFVFATKWIMERKFWHYLVFIWIMHYIHNSALMLVPLYFINYLPSLADKRNICLPLFLVCFIAGLTPQLQALGQYVDVLASLAGYEQHAEFIVNRLNEGAESEEAKSFGLTMLSYFLCSLVPIILGPKLKNFFGNKISRFNLWYNYSFIYSCLYFLFSNTSHIIGRPVSYLSLFLMLVIAMTIIFLKSNTILANNRKLTKNLFILIIWTCTIWGMYKASKNGAIDFATYKIFLFHEKGGLADYYS